MALEEVDFREGLEADALAEFINRRVIILDKDHGFVAGDVVNDFDSEFNYRLKIPGTADSEVLLQYHDIKKIYLPSEE